MKATKIASIFAVTAIAAAVSTTTIAAEAVFSGEAGLQYKMLDSGDVLDASDFAEIELAIDTGLVYAEVEYGTNATASGKSTLDIEKIYVKQGAVQFGKFDGTLSDGAFYGNDDVYGGVTVASKQAAIRYEVAKGLKVAIEGSDAVDSDGNTVLGFAAVYKLDMGAAKVALSAGSLDEDTVYNLGLQFTGGPATVSLNYGGGEVSDADKAEVNLTIEAALSDSFVVSLEYGDDTESDASDDGMVVIASYTVDSVRYYVENGSGDFFGDAKEYTEIGAKVEF